jgi:hypothetical protein
MGLVMSTLSTGSLDFAISTSCERRGERKWLQEGARRSRDRDGYIVIAAIRATADTASVGGISVAVSGVRDDRAICGIRLPGPKAPIRCTSAV